MSEQNNDDVIHSEGQVSQFLTFLLGAETYGINILDIREIIEYGGITSVPMMPEFISGVINLRGAVVPVIDLSSRFDGGQTLVSKRTSIIIAEVENEDLKLEVGVIVDVVNEVLNILDKDIEPAPAFGSKIRTDFISGMGKVNDELLVLLEVRKVLSIEELATVKGIGQDQKKNE